MEYRISYDLEQLCDKVLDDHPELEHLRDCRIGFLYADKEKKAKHRTVYADTEKVSAKMKALCHYDFVITFYEPSCSGLDEERMKILMYHELRHVGYCSSDESCCIIPHDVEDFKDIILEHGPDWINGGRGKT